MAPKNRLTASVRAVRQLQRLRFSYLIGVLLWLVAAALTGLHHPGSRQMWASVLLLTVFTGLLTAASLWLRSVRAAAREGEPAHHAAPAGRPAPAMRTAARRTAPARKATPRHA